MERRGFLEVDTRCRLLAAGPRTALEAGAQQARGALLRSGWTRARLEQLEQATIRAARSRACNDPRNQTAAAQAQAGFATWSRTNSMTFPGAERTWIARRYVDPLGWRLRQDIDATAVFGVREREGVQRLTLMIRLTSGQSAPNAVQILVRDRTRADVDVLELRGRTANGLAAGAPTAGNATAYFASTRSIETTERNRYAVVEFPDAAFQALLALDPRETAELRLERGRTSERLLVEVGDLSVARGFLALRPEA
ncbi:hypothetical protein U91I_02481 [alpha proteobacterium U9-1i]|nr:hypothetical protein U91I_02481 [alpha proteobacterium U9-1i]